MRVLRHVLVLFFDHTFLEKNLPSKNTEHVYSDASFCAAMQSGVSDYEDYHEGMCIF